MSHTAAHIEAELLRTRWFNDTCIPNFTPHQWFECDVAQFTAAGYLREYEIKVSRADFFVDAKKESEVLPRKYRAPVVMENKHALLAAGSTRGPVQFWFVVPQGLIRINEVPSWAGLIEISGKTGFRLSEHEALKAPRLHGEKIHAKTIKHADSCSYYRWHRLLSQSVRLQQVAKTQAAELRALRAKIAA
jgi:hypothetical protein